MFKTLVFLVELFDFLTPFHFPHYGFVLLLILTGLLWHVQPFCLGRIICFPDGASGIVTSIGLFGYESWIGILEGKLEYNGVTDVAALGFTGLKIFLPAFGSVYFGYAQHVSIMDYGGPDINFKA